MRKQVFFPGARFPVAVLDAAASVINGFREPPHRSSSSSSSQDDEPLVHANLTYVNDEASWTFDEWSDWKEAYTSGGRAAGLVLALPRRSIYNVKVAQYPVESRLILELEYADEAPFAGTSIAVSAASSEWIDRVLELFEATVAAPRFTSQLKADRLAAPTIFIGHGRDDSWRDLKDHLLHQQGYLVEAYETGARAGHDIRDILESMMSTSAFALLVMTGDDETADGTRRARQNVIHEAGLFQGRLGWHRAILLVEEGIEEFSNVSGLQQIRFAKGRIRETFGDVLATLRREFGDR